MDASTDTAHVKDLLVKASEILIVTHEKPTFDSLGSSLALYLGLTGLGKRVTVACPDPVTVELSSFVAANKVATSLAKKNFIISLDYVDGSIEKVSYNIEGNKFNLVIEPRPGFESFSQDKVRYAYAGVSADAILVVDTIHLGGLGKLYEENKELFATKPVVNIDWHPNNSHFGKLNIVDHRAGTTAELIGEFLAGVGAPLTADIATNILNALYAGTDSFQSLSVTSRSFELAAACIKAGGKRFVRQTAAMQTGAVQSVPVPPAAPKAPVQPAVPASSAPQTAPQVSGQAPADWLKPKIFKSSSIA